MGYTNFENLPSEKTPFSATVLKQMQVDLMEMVFPIGSTYVTQTDVNPSTILEFGTWERVKGKVLVGLDENDTDFNIIGHVGGEKTHTLTVDEMPSHNHSLPLNNGEEAGAYFSYEFGEGRRVYSGTDIIGAYGGNLPHNNLQPYRVVGYMWIRMA